MGIYMCMKSGCLVSGEDFAHAIIPIKASAFIGKHSVLWKNSIRYLLPWIFVVKAVFI